MHTVEHSISVHPTAQGRGLGRALPAALTERAQAQGKHVMVAGIEGSNAASIALHRRAGFEVAGQLREVGRKLGRSLDLLFMQRTFSGPANPDG